MAEHAVLVHLKLSDEGFGTEDEMVRIHALSDELTVAIEEADAGEFDGDDFGEGESVLFMYGPDADALFAAIEKVLRASPLSKGGRVVKRYGEASDPDAKEVSVVL